MVSPYRPRPSSWTPRCPGPRATPPWASFTDGILENINSQDPEGIRKLIVMGCGLFSVSLLPVECLSKRSCCAWVHKLYQALGCRFQGSWANNYVDQQGHITWQRGGVYRWDESPEEGTLSLKHMGGQRSIPKLISCVEGATEIQFNRSDREAEFSVMEVKCRRTLPGKGSCVEEFLSQQYQRDLAKALHKGADDKKKEAESATVVVAESAEKAVKKPPPTKPKLASARQMPAKPCPKPALKKKVT